MKLLLLAGTAFLGLAALGSGARADAVRLYVFRKPRQLYDTDHRLLSDPRLWRAGR